MRRRVGLVGGHHGRRARVEDAVQLLVQGVKGISVEGRENGDAEAEPAALHGQHAHRHDVEELGRAGFVYLATGAGVALAQPHDLRDDVFGLGGDHDERSQSGDVMHVVEADHGEAVRAAMHLNDEPVGRDRDDRADGAAPVVSRHRSAPRRRPSRRPWSGAPASPRRRSGRTAAAAAGARRWC